MPISAASSVWCGWVRRIQPWSPTASSIWATSPRYFGVNSPNELFSNVGLSVADVKAGPFNIPTTIGVAPVGSIGTCFGIESKGNKIMYFSPSFAGLTFGVSFTPTGGQRRAGGGLSYGTDVTAPGPGNAGNNVLSVGVDYTTTSAAGI